MISWTLIVTLIVGNGQVQNATRNIHSAALCSAVASEIMRQVPNSTAVCVKEVGI